MAKNTNELIKKAEELFNQEKFQEIITLLTYEVLEKQKKANLYAWKAFANYKLGVDDTATMLLAEKAIETDSKYYMGYFVRACILRVKEKYDKAIADYDRAIDVNPDFADAYYYRGLVWQSKKEKEKAIDDFDKAIKYYTEAIENNSNDENLYLQRGIVQYYKGDYHKAIDDYTKAIIIKSDLTLAYYNRGLARAAIKDKDAITDFSEIIKIMPDNADAYVSRGNIKRVFNEDYDGAIDDYTTAIEIDSNNTNAYYNRGLAKRERELAKKENNLILDGSKQDFERYIELINKKNNIDKNDIGIKYAKYYIEEINVLISDPDLIYIRKIIENIKNILLIKCPRCLTHYTSLSTLTNLIIKDSKFRIFEGNYMNDPSEGETFFKFLQYNPYSSPKGNSISETFSFQPFIGSFIDSEKSDDLNMWRFYGKEEGVEGKGCSVTLRAQKFIDDIENFLSNEKNKEARLDDENDMHFYRVVYVIQDENGGNSFYIPNLDKCAELTNLMGMLKKEIKNYSLNNKLLLEKYLNSIAFLFKTDAYKNENEVRLVVKGIEFEKNYNMDATPPKVYIELASIRDIVSGITLGPKVDKVREWKAAFYYSYENMKSPEVKKSQVPFK